ncbi:MAG: hypothetical protein U0704_01710 [Candidatus Eisenbacteria bacterium]
MDMQGKTSQGIPIGPDTSFILAELVLAAVDREAKLASDNVFRWYDDYEVACVTRQAEAALQSVRSLQVQGFAQMCSKPQSSNSLIRPATDGKLNSLD